MRASKLHVGWGQETVNVINRSHTIPGVGEGDGIGGEELSTCVGVGVASTVGCSVADVGMSTPHVQENVCNNRLFNTRIHL